MIVDGPGTAWSNAFHTIQGAVNASTNGDTILVANGIYDAGGAVTPSYVLTNRVGLTNPVNVRSVNGPTNTCIVGNHSESYCGGLYFREGTVPTNC